MNSLNMAPLPTALTPLKSLMPTCSLTLVDVVLSTTDPLFYPELTIAALIFPPGPLSYPLHLNPWTLIRTTLLPLGLTPNPWSFLTPSSTKTNLPPPAVQTTSSKIRMSHFLSNCNFIETPLVLFFFKPIEGIIWHREKRRFKNTWNVFNLYNLVLKKCFEISTHTLFVQSSFYSHSTMVWKI